MALSIITNYFVEKLEKHFEAMKKLRCKKCLSKMMQKRINLIYSGMILIDYSKYNKPGNAIYFS
jgi:hypothetical protein